MKRWQYGILPSLFLGCCTLCAQTPTNSVIASNSIPASPESGIVKPTGTNVVDPKPDVLIAQPDKELVGLNPTQVIAKLGHPKEVKFAAVDSTAVELWTWYYFYEFSEEWFHSHRPGEKFHKRKNGGAILSIRFSEGKVKDAYWLPSF